MLQLLLRELISGQEESIALHGNVHHGNILHFRLRGWLAIDPKGLCSKRGFDYANLFCNPDHQVSTDAVRFVQRLSTVTQVAGLERQRLLICVLAWAGLSAGGGTSKMEPHHKPRCA